MGLKQQVGAWTVFAYEDGQFKHARHSDPSVLIVWTLEEFQVADPIACAEYDLSREPAQ